MNSLNFSLRSLVAIPLTSLVLVAQVDLREIAKASTFSFIINLYGRGAIRYARYNRRRVARSKSSATQFWLMSLLRAVKA